MPVSTGVTSLSAGSTGLTPATPRTGAVTIAGTLAAGSGGTGLSSPGSSGNVLTSDGTAWTSSASAGGVSITNDTSNESNLFPLFANATSGTASNVFTSNAKLLYKPSSGELAASAPIAANGIFVNSTTVSTSYTIASGYNGLSVGAITVSSGVTVTITSGQRWLIL